VELATGIAGSDSNYGLDSSAKNRALYIGNAITGKGYEVKAVPSREGSHKGVAITFTKK
jgi:hypothetical protein